METKYLIPDNRTEFEIALLQSFDKFLNDIEQHFGDLRDAAKCPVDALLYLANDHGVTNWNESFSESDKRSIIQNQWPLRALSGTRQGVLYAIASQGMTGTLANWGETGGTPYTTQVKLNTSKQPISDTKNLSVHSAIGESLNERDNYSIQHQSRVNGSLFVGGMVTTAIKVTLK